VIVSDRLSVRGRKVGQGQRKIAGFGKKQTEPKANQLAGEL